MIRINDKTLTNEEIRELLEKETGLVGGKIKGEAHFKLLENYESRLKRLKEDGEVFYEKKYQATYGLHNTYERRNFTDGGSESITYYTNTIGDHKVGVQYRTNDVNKVVFQNGYLIVHPGQEDLLLFLRLNEQCKSNKYWSETDTRGNQKYQPNKSFLYKEIVEEVESEHQFQEAYENVKAQVIVMNPEKLPIATAMTMATAYGMQDAKYKSEHGIRMFLLAKAKANPEHFIKDLNDAGFELRAKINSAFTYNILKWDAPYIRWAKMTSGDNRVVSVPTGRDHVDYLTFWLKEIDKSGKLNEVLGKVEREVLNEHGYKIPDLKPATEYDLLLQELGVGSIDEAKKIIAAGKQAAPANTASNIDVTDICQNINDYDHKRLLALGGDTLKAVIKKLGIKGQGIHLINDAGKLADAILKAQKPATA